MDASRQHAERADGKSEPGSNKKGFYRPCSLVSAVYPPLLIVGAISIPWGAILLWRARVNDRRLLKRMKIASRSITVDQLMHDLNENRGTLLIEAVSPKLPTRIWFVPEDIRSTSPYQCEPHGGPSKYLLAPAPELESFYKWCEGRFTDESSGSGFLVEVSNEERATIQEMAKNSGFLVTWKVKDKER